MRANEFAAKDRMDPALDNVSGVLNGLSFALKLKAKSREPCCSCCLEKVVFIFPGFVTMNRFRNMLENVSIRVRNKVHKFKRDIIRRQL